MGTEDKSDLEMLRKKAEVLLRKNSSESELQFNEADILKLVHELDVHRVELEMQQEELLKAKERAVEATRKYDELHDLHNRFIMHMLKRGNTLE